MRVPTTVSPFVEYLVAGLGFALALVIVTWPQASLLTTHAHGHHDVLFNMWRISWIAEALTSTPLSLFDAPIFAPTPRTLAFSDAVLLQGLMALPFLKAGVPALPVYNVLLLLGPWMSAMGAYLLVRDLTGSRAAGAVAGMIFGLVPYRIDHAMHLEIQWSQWMPLTMWALHRTWRRGRVGDGVLTGVFLLLQFISCIYYGVFLVLFLLLMAPVLFWAERPPNIRRTVAALAIGAAVIAVPLGAYAVPYKRAQEALGTRSPDEIAKWSATWGSYVATPWNNRLYGPYLARFGRQEGFLFPGAVAAGLALIALVRPTRLALAYVWGLICAVVLSLGSNTPIYGLVITLVPPLGGLRAPGRFGMLAALAVAVLAGIGMARLMRRWPAPRPAAVPVVVACALMTVEYASDFGPLHAWTQRPPTYARWLRTEPPGGVVHLPAPTASALPLHDAEWSYLGTFDWRPRVNGYSGYYPPQYIDLLAALRGFPSGEALRALSRRGVSYVILHEDRFDPGDFLELLGRMEDRPELEAAGRFHDRLYPVTIYRLTVQP
jgi:hypothetical protein